MPDIFKHIFNDSTAYSSEELVSIFRQVSDKINILHNYSFSDFSVLSNRMKEYYTEATSIFELIDQLTAFKTNQEQNLTQQVQNTLKDISSIVTKLQFHDIVRQRLEHIQQANEYIIKELLAFPQKNLQTKAHNTYLSIIPDIVRLHIAQLTYTNLEYQNTFADIKNNLQSIKANIVAASEICATFLCLPENKQNINNNTKHIIELINRLSQEIDSAITDIKYCESFKKIAEEITNHLIATFPGADVSKSNPLSGKENPMLRQLRNTYTMESERIVYDQVFGTELPGDKNTNPVNMDSGNTPELF